MKFKIVQCHETFYVKQRFLFLWLTVHRELGWNCSEPHPFKSDQDAQDHIKELIWSTVEIEHTYAADSSGPCSRH